MENKSLSILMPASENDALPGGKVGGVGDVIRDVPVALAQLGHDVHVVVPSYGKFHLLDEAHHVCQQDIIFRGIAQQVNVYKIVGKYQKARVTQWVIDHPNFLIDDKGSIYFDDGSDRPFASDANRFALFSEAVANAIINRVFGHIDVLHLHDWHTSFIAILRAYDERFFALKSLPTVFTIHNLSLQGIRPIEGDESSFSAWFPTLSVDGSKLIDPRYSNCINPMLAGINLADKVHAVSPTYAKEILQPSNPVYGFIGAEGLEFALQRKASEGNLIGILNGCEYPENSTIETPQPTKKLEQLLQHCEATILQWMDLDETPKASHLVALSTIRRIIAKPSLPKLLLTSVGRLTPQKVAILLTKINHQQSVLDYLLEDVIGDDSLFVMVGSGNEQEENWIDSIAQRHSNFLFIKGYSQALSDQVFACGDLFLMPSSFEPCGISQMLALRAGQPCVVHGVGGLNDTIFEQENGFVFYGKTPTEQGQNFLAKVQEAIEVYQQDPRLWQQLVDNAKSSRFLWQDSVKLYVEHLYSN